MILTVYDFKIFYKSERINFANELSKRSDYEKISTLNIKFLSSLQSKLALSINIRNFKKMFNDAFELTDVQRLKFVLNAKNFMKMFENALTRLSVQKFKSSANV